MRWFLPKRIRLYWRSATESLEETFQWSRWRRRSRIRMVITSCTRILRRLSTLSLNIQVWNKGGRWCFSCRRWKRVWYLVGQPEVSRHGQAVRNGYVEPERRINGKLPTSCRRLRWVLEPIFALLGLWITFLRHRVAQTENQTKKNQIQAGLATQTKNQFAKDSEHSPIDSGPPRFYVRCSEKFR